MPLRTHPLEQYQPVPEAVDHFPKLGVWRIPAMNDQSEWHKVAKDTWMFNNPVTETSYIAHSKRNPARR